MFQDLDEIGACLVPLFPKDMDFNEVDDLDEGDVVHRLFRQLKEARGSRAENAGPLEIYLQECGVSRLIDGDFQSFCDANYASSEVKVTSPRGIYERAVALFSQEEYTQAVGFFCLIASLHEKAAGSLIALSACASRQALYKSGYNLAIASIKADDKHPRSHLLAGYCALRLNDLRSAKRYLALASRLARRDPMFRPEQRAAQQQLLSLQFS